MKDVELTVKIDDETKDALVEISDKLNLSVDEYVTKLIKNEITKTVNFSNGFYYNRHTTKLYNDRKEEVNLTKTEKNLFILLLENRNNIVDASTIHSIVWKGKNMSIYTLRNMIKNIRDKTYYELIKNHSNLGYSLN